MCTSIKWVNGDFYFGRNMDIGYSFNEEVIITPRNFEITFKHEEKLKDHYAIIGMAMDYQGYPLYADAMNEMGLAMAGLNFPGYAHYHSNINEDKVNLAPYEFILWILSKYNTVCEVKSALSNIQFMNTPYADELPLSTLHFMISDSESSIVVESTKDGLKVFDNPVEVMTNNPTFDFHLTNLSNYMHCTPMPSNSSITDKLAIKPLGCGSGTLGLPGDMTTTSRFVRAVYVKSHMQSEKNEEDNLAAFFHCLDSVAVVKGNVVTSDLKPDYTTYTSCMNVDKKIYYYKSYSNNQIQGIKMMNENLESNKCIKFKLNLKQCVKFWN